MRTSLIAAALAAFAGSSALAADLPAPPSFDPAPPAFSWTGFYAGGNVGGVWASPSSSVIGGGQIGYNWQPGWLMLGAEADIEGMRLRHSALLTNTIGHSITSNTSVDYLGTVRGRTGVAFSRWLAYATGGLAYTTINHDGAGVTGVSGNYSGSDNKVGYTVGGGLEWAFLDRWSAKTEYLFASTPGQTDTYTTTSHPIRVTYSNAKFSILRLGVNYRFQP